MKFFSTRFICVSFLSVGMSATLLLHKSEASVKTDHSSKNNLQLIHSGGVPSQFGSLCPTAANDTIVPITLLNPPANENQPEMTIDGINLFIQKNKITTIEQLLSYFPDHYRNNFSLVETTRATGQSSLAYPRIILFGSDGHLLLNIGTKADDPKYHLLDVAEMHEDTGNWEFSVFNFNGEKPALTRNDPTCAQCHGTKNARPFWGTVLEWPGVFGDNIAPGPQGEALDTRHMERMNEIKAGKGGSPRFDFLMWDPEPLHRGGKRKIANNIFGAELLVSNMAMGTATARASFIRLTKNNPVAYKLLREELLLAYYLKKGNAFLEKKQIAAFEKIDKKFNIKNYDLDSLLTLLTLDPKEGFSLATLAAVETPNPSWSMGKGDLYDMVMLQVLDDLRKDNKEVAALLARTETPQGIVDCPKTTPTLADIVDIKMLQLFYLRGDARYQVNQKFYLLDGEDIYDRVFIPASSKLIPYLKAHVGI